MNTHRLSTGDCSNLSPPFRMLPCPPWLASTHTQCHLAGHIILKLTRLLSQTMGEKANGKKDTQKQVDGNIYSNNKLPVILHINDISFSNFPLSTESGNIDLVMITLNFFYQHNCSSNSKKVSHLNILCN